MVLRHAEKDYPMECCGVLLGQAEPDGASVTRVVPTRNQQFGRPHDRYEISPQDLLQAMRLARKEGVEVIGYYHSHPDRMAIPSSTDESSAWPEVSYVIVAVEKGNAGEVRSWRCAEGVLVEETIAESALEECSAGRKNG
jgi:proteasome lid subunit RPN8/RPN11